MAKNLIAEMKEAVKKSGSSKKEILYFPADSNHRVRFLQELDEGLRVEMHNDFEAKLFAPCRDMENHEDCPYCSDGVAIQENYIWSVWDYDSNSVKLLMFKASGVSPIPGLIEVYEEFGSVKDRDIKIKKVGKGTGSSFVVTALDKSRFRNDKAKPYKEKQVFEILYKAYPLDDEKESDEDEDEVPKKKSKSKKKKEPTLREKFEKLDMEELKSICLEIGMSKKEFKAFDDEEEVLDELFDNYEEDDLAELLENLDDDEDEDDDDE